MGAAYLESGVNIQVNKHKTIEGVRVIWYPVETVSVFGCGDHTIVHRDAFSMHYDAGIGPVQNVYRMSPHGVVWVSY